MRCAQLTLCNFAARGSVYTTDLPGLRYKESNQDRCPMLRQLFLCLVIAAATFASWIAFVPSATAILDRAGLLDLLGVEIAEARGEQGDLGGFTGADPIRVVTAEVTKGIMNDTIATIGDGRAIRSVEVRSDAAGLITELGAVAGERVEEGAVVARLDDRAETIAVERARIVLADAQDEVDRSERLQSTGAVPAILTRAAELALRSAELDLRQAELDLAERVIRAPISGWLGLSDTDIGDRVAAQEVLATISDRSEVLVEFRVPERVVGQIAVGMPFEAAPLAEPDLELTGEISAIDATIDRTSRTLRVRGRLDNSEDRLRAGMAFSIGLSLPGNTYPSIDPLALQWSSEGSFVWVVDDGLAVRVPVLIRQRNADSILVEAALAIGQSVVTEGVQTLRSGDEVTVVEPAQASIASAPAAPDET